MPEQAPAPGAGLAQSIAAMRSYRAGLLDAGRLLEARAVAHCITLASKPARQIGAGDAIATPAATTPR